MTKYTVVLQELNALGNVIVEYVDADSVKKAIEGATYLVYQSSRTGWTPEEIKEDPLYMEDFSVTAVFEGELTNLMTQEDIKEYGY